MASDDVSWYGPLEAVNYETFFLPMPGNFLRVIRSHYTLDLTSSTHLIEVEAGEVLVVVDHARALRLLDGALVIVGYSSRLFEIVQ